MVWMIRSSRTIPLTVPADSCSARSPSRAKRRPGACANSSDPEMIFSDVWSPVPASAAIHPNENNEMGLQQIETQYYAI